MVETQLFGQMISLLRYCPFKESFLVPYIRLFLSSILLAWLVKKYLFGLISHRTLSLSVLRRKFPACVAPSWCYFQGMVCCLQQIGGLDGFVFICLQSGSLKREAHGGPVTSRAHCHRQYFHERVTCVLGLLLREECEERSWRYLRFSFILASQQLCLWMCSPGCWTAAPQGGQRAKAELRGWRRFSNRVDKISFKASNYLIANFRCTWKQADYICGPYSTTWHHPIALFLCHTWM